MWCRGVRKYNRNKYTAEAIDYLEEYTNLGKVTREMVDQVAPKDTRVCVYFKVCISIDVILNHYMCAGTWGDKTIWWYRWVLILFVPHCLLMCFLTCVVAVRYISTSGEHNIAFDDGTEEEVNLLTLGMCRGDLVKWHILDWHIWCAWAVFTLWAVLKVNIEVNLVHAILREIGQGLFYM